MDSMLRVKRGYHKRGGDFSSPFSLVRNGFTLIELMVVVAIIGILAALALSAYDIYTKKAKVGEITNALGSAMSAAQQYHGEQGHWPGPVDAVVAGSVLLALCRDSFGVALPTTYVSENDYTWEASDQELTITARFRTVSPPGKIIGSGVNGTLLSLSSGADGGMRNWGGDIASKYRPK